MVPKTKDSSVLSEDTIKLGVMCETQGGYALVWQAEGHQQEFRMLD
jgi:hypothetical protein